MNNDDTQKNWRSGAKKGLEDLISSLNSKWPEERFQLSEVSTHGSPSNGYIKGSFNYEANGLQKEFHFRVTKPFTFSRMFTNAHQSLLTVYDYDSRFMGGIHNICEARIDTQDKASDAALKVRHTVNHYL